MQCNTQARTYQVLYEINLKRQHCHRTKKSLNRARYQYKVSRHLTEVYILATFMTNAGLPLRIQQLVAVSSRKLHHVCETSSNRILPAAWKVTGIRRRASHLKQATMTVRFRVPAPFNAEMTGTSRKDAVGVFAPPVPQVDCLGMSGL